MFREVLAQQPVAVLVAGPLSKAGWVHEVDLHFGLRGDAGVAADF